MGEILVLVRPHFVGHSSAGQSTAVGLERIEDVAPILEGMESTMVEIGEMVLTMEGAGVMETTIINLANVLVTMGGRRGVLNRHQDRAGAVEELLGIMEAGIMDGMEGKDSTLGTTIIMDAVSVIASALGPLSVVIFTEAINALSLSILDRIRTANA